MVHNPSINNIDTELMNEMQSYFVVGGNPRSLTKTVVTVSFTAVSIFLMIVGSERLHVNSRTIVGDKVSFGRTKYKSIK